MSQTPKKQEHRKPFPWPLMALGGILLLVAAFFFTNQGGGIGTPSITVDQQKIDFGTQKFGTNLTFVVNVTNTGNGTLRFKEDPYIEIVEGC